MITVRCRKCPFRSTVRGKQRLTQHYSRTDQSAGHQSYNPNRLFAHDLENMATFFRLDGKVALIVLIALKGMGNTFGYANTELLKL